MLCTQCRHTILIKLVKLSNVKVLDLNFWMLINISCPFILIFEVYCSFLRLFCCFLDLNVFASFFFEKQISVQTNDNKSEKKQLCACLCILFLF